jgi:diguanylate cyclase (GGDEF)-like protein
MVAMSAPGGFNTIPRPSGLGRPRFGFGLLRTLPARLQASEYVTVGDGQRYRAAQRRRTATASRVGFLLIAGSAAFDAVVLYDRQPGQGPVLLVLNGAMAALALAGWWLVGRRPLRHYPEAAAFVITLALTLATAATGVVLPVLAFETVGYILLLPGLITLIVPWRTVTHARWLWAYGLVGLGYIVFGPSDVLTGDDRADLVVVLLIALVASFAGHVLLQRGQIRNFSQLQKIQALHRQADADMAELARVHRVLEETARTDPLTGAGNRIRLGEDLRAARARMNRLGHAHGLIVVDLDRFKLINDRLGHLAGDEVLRETVAAIQRTIRADDAIYRFGGEEFLVIVRVPDRDSLAAAAERVRAAVERSALHHPENPPGSVVTVSLGGILVTSADLVASDDDWFARADAALYEAKETGRNRVVLAD